MQLFAYYHTHWDREWYQPFREYQIRLAEVGDEILSRLDQGVFSCFTWDGQTIVLEDYLELRPQNREKLERYIRSGKLSIGPWYVMPDEFLVSGESLVRNLLLGMAQSVALGCQAFTGYLPDTFGHSGDMPLIFKQLGIQTAIVWRGISPAYAEFIWQSRDKSSVLGYYLVDGYFQNCLHDPKLTEAERTTALAQWVEKAVSKSSQGDILFPVGGDHLGPVPILGPQFLKQAYPQLQETTTVDYLNQQLAQLNPDQLTVYQGELTDCSDTFILPGVYSSRLYLKQENRRLEHGLVKQLEPLLALRQWLNPTTSYPTQELALAWKTLIQNHPHDSICGCSVDEVHQENEVRFNSVHSILQALLRRQLYSLVEAVPSNHWLVFNQGDQPYTGVLAVTVPIRSESPSPSVKLLQLEQEITVLEDSYLYDLNEVPMAHCVMQEQQGYIWVEAIPAHGAKSLPVEGLSPSSSVMAQLGQITNGLIRLEVDDSGELTVTDLKTGQVYPLQHCITYRAQQGDSYNAAPVPDKNAQKAVFLEQAIKRNGPLKATLSLTYELSAQKLFFTVDVSILAGSSQVEFETTFTNTQPNCLIQVGFQLVQPITSVLAESHFGIETRQYDPHYAIEKAMPVSPQKELKTNTGPIQRFILVQNQLWVTEGLTEYEVADQTLGLTLLRAFGVLSSGETQVRGAQAGPPLPTPSGQCLGRTISARYSWQPCQSIPQAYQAADLFYGVLSARLGRTVEVPSVGEPKSLITWDNPAIVTSALYWSSLSNAFVLRVINTAGSSQPILFLGELSQQACWQCDFREQKKGQLIETKDVLAPNAVQTYLFQVK